jgi:hypothetical protein
MRTDTAGLAPSLENIDIWWSFLLLFLYHDGTNFEKVMPIADSCQAFFSAVP